MQAEIIQSALQHGRFPWICESRCSTTVEVITIKIVSHTAKCLDVCFSVQHQTTYKHKKMEHHHVHNCLVLPSPSPSSEERCICVSPDFCKEVTAQGPCSSWWHPEFLQAADVLPRNLNPPWAKAFAMVRMYIQHGSAHGDVWMEKQPQPRPG